MPSFFNKMSGTPVKRREPEYHFIDVGGEQFHALAIALMDYLKSTPRTNDAILKKILDRFFTDFPQYKPDQRYLSLTECMGLLINHPRKSDIVECMAYVLRQLAVDELYTRPEQYHEAFNGLSCETSEDYIRQPATKLPICVLSALAHVLDIPINLSIKEPGKELGARVIFGNHSEHVSQKEIMIQIIGEHYIPGVKHTNDFTFVGQLAIHPPKPINRATEKECSTIAPFCATIKTYKKELAHNYLYWRKNLLSMEKADELTKEDLLMLYTKLLPPSHGMNGIADSATFFFELEQQDRTHVPEDSFSGAERQMTVLLVNALARGISTKHIDPDQLFEYLENAPQKKAITT